MPVSLASNSAGSPRGALVPIGRVSASILNTTNPMSFINIPQIYQDLMLVVSGRSTLSDMTNDFAITINNDYTTLYSRNVLQGQNNAISTFRESSNGYYYPRLARTGAGATVGSFGSSITHILNYANTLRFKTILTRASTDINGSGNTTFTSGLYRSTSGINRLDLFSNGGNWASGSTATLYGIRTISQ
jgi:hypothetical protein